MASSSSSLPERKVLLVGNGGSGKTTFITAAISGQFVRKYIPTVSVTVSSLTTESHVLNFWDTAGQEKFGFLREGYYIGADVVMIFISQDSPYNNVQSWYKEVRRVCPHVPVMLVRSKSDLKGLITEPLTGNHCPYGLNFAAEGQISVKSGTGLTEILEKLCHIL